ncbi:MAG: hypothetical protein GXP25_07145, partial [Planctomycetes bacterium]|nr:hypothetical protein [Planctomycetota bacterium]
MVNRCVTTLRLFCLLGLLQVAACDDTTRTNFCQNGGFESGKAQWAGNCTIDNNVKHSGRASVRFDNKEEHDESIISQIVVLNQTAAIPIVVSGWSKAQNATGRKNHNYSLWCDVEYVNDIRPGKVDDWHTVQFDTGTHDWQYVESIFNPKYPIKQIRFHALFRRSHAGTVWFDDLALKPLSDGPLAGTAAGVPKAKADDPTVAMLRERVAAAAPDEVLVSIQAVPSEKEGPRDTFRCFLGDEPMAELPRSGAKGVFWKFPLQYPPHLPRINPPAPFAWLRLTRIWEKQQLILRREARRSRRVAHPPAEEPRGDRNDAGGLGGKERRDLVALPGRPTAAHARDRREGRRRPVSRVAPLDDGRKGGRGDAHRAEAPVPCHKGWSNARPRRRRRHLVRRRGRCGCHVSRCEEAPLRAARRRHVQGPIQPGPDRCDAGG